jgi:hypothetical protein
LSFQAVFIAVPPPMECPATVSFSKSKTGLLLNPKTVFRNNGSSISLSTLRLHVISRVPNLRFESSNVCFSHLLAPKW